MSLVVCGIYPSVNAAYRAKASSLNVSRTAVYGKLNGIYLVLVLRCYIISGYTGMMLTVDG